MPLHHKFLVADVKEQAILGMDFLERHGALMNFKTAELIIGRQRLPCVTQDGRAIVARVYLAKDTTIPSQAETITTARTQKPLSGPTVLIDSLESKQPCMIGSSLAQNHESMPIRLLNTTPETVRLPAGKIIGLASSITDNEVVTTDHFQGPTLRRIDTGRPAPPIPDHLQQLWEAAQPTCQKEDHQNQLRHLLDRYQHVFSKTDTDVGCTNEVMHSIPTIPGAQLSPSQARA
jgi:hypothetical protein